MTTTAVRLHPENETRQFAIPVSDTPAHTRHILRAIANAHSGEENRKPSIEDLESWVSLQVWIDHANHKVVVPYAGPLAELIPPVAVRLRRDFTAILNLIEAHAILHQVNRSVDKHGRIVADIADYRAVRQLDRQSSPRASNSHCRKRSGTLSKRFTRFAATMPQMWHMSLERRRIPAPQPFSKSQRCCN